MVKDILDYLESKYHPVSILVYGSYMRGDQDEYSDFDCMIITSETNVRYDETVIDGIQLDCMIFSKEECQNVTSIEMVKIYDAKVIKDDGTGRAIKQKVRDFVDENSKTSKEEKDKIVNHIFKTFDRLQRKTPDSDFRCITMLEKSLPNYFFLRDLYFHGSKNSLIYLKTNDPIGYQLFTTAVQKRTNEAIFWWIKHVVDGQKR